MKYFTILLFCIGFLSACNTKESAKSIITETSANEKTTAADAVQVLYFHYERRCTTCKTVEALTSEIVGNEYRTTAIFEAFNLDTEEGAAMGKSVGVDEQTLLILRDDKKINLTNEAFLYAGSDEEKFKQVFREKMAEVL